MYPPLELDSTVSPADLVFRRFEVLRSFLLLKMNSHPKGMSLLRSPFAILLCLVFFARTISSASSDPRVLASKNGGPNIYYSPR